MYYYDNNFNNNNNSQTIYEVYQIIYIDNNLINNNNMNSNRFVIRKTLIGKDVVITFTNKKGEVVKYNHDDVYNTHKERFESMNCFQKYKSYTNTNCMPKFCRDMKITK